MCRTLSTKSKMKEESLKKVQKISTKIQNRVTYTLHPSYEPLDLNLTDLSTAMETSDMETDMIQVAIVKKEKSRIAAKNRRCLENERLTDLYNALPVASQSRLLCYDSTEFMGNFEKTTIIKIAAYILKFYNVLPIEALRGPRCGVPRLGATSIFSQSIFGCFWSKELGKLLFTSPGLAGLTGLYWCNMIGMPKDIILGPDQPGSGRLHEVLLRLTMNATKDRGIFTVNPQRLSVCLDASRMASIDPNGGTNTPRHDMLANLPCSIWCSIKLSPDLTLDLIQPMALKPFATRSKTTKKLKETQQLAPQFPPPYHQIDLPALPPPPNAETPRRRVHKASIGASAIVKPGEPILPFTGHLLTIYVDGASLMITEVDGDTVACTAIESDLFLEYTLYDLFHLEDLISIYQKVNRLRSNPTCPVVERGVARICCSRLSENERRFRWAVYVLQSGRTQQVKVSNISHYRSIVRQGEAYSSNLINQLSTPSTSSAAEAAAAAAAAAADSDDEYTFNIQTTLFFCHNAVTHSQAAFMQRNSSDQGLERLISNSMESEDWQLSKLMENHASYFMPCTQPCDNTMK